MSVPDGMFLYEFVLLILGAIMFIVLLFLLIILVKRGNDIKILLAFFLMPLLMIGFPGIQKIQFDNGAIALEKKMSQIAGSVPTDEEKEELKETVKRLESRPISSPEINQQLSEAYKILGDTARSVYYDQKAQETMISTGRIRRIR